MQLMGIKTSQIRSLII